MRAFGCMLCICALRPFLLAIRQGETTKLAVMMVMVVVVLLTD